MGKTFAWVGATLLLLAAGLAGAATLARIDRSPLPSDTLPPLRSSAPTLAATAPLAWLEPEHATPVTEIPEPASLALVATGLFGLAVLGRKRQL